MRKIYLTLGCAAVALMASAQLPDPTFSSWVDCIPWTSNNNTKAVGTTPEGWTVSNVVGINGLGATTVGKDTTGVDGGHAVYVFNASNTVLPTQTVPGYLTLGTTWSTSVMGSNNDGGCFGGIKCTNRPDGVAVKLQRSVVEGNTQMATAVGYIWTGTFTQKDVPASIAAFGSAVKTDMVNRDRNILGMETALGGEVTATEGAALIAKFNRPIVTVTSDDEWQDITFPFEYVNDAQPEMLNLIFAANDYFGESSSIQKDNSLTIAQPKLVYWSKLLGITIDGKEISGFEETKYEYNVGTLPAASAVKVSLMGQDSEARIEEVDGKIVITVTNPSGTDEEGLSEHVYTLEGTQEKPDEPAGPSTEYTGKLTIEMSGDDITEGGWDATVSITPDTNGTYIFLLPNFSIDLGDGNGPVNLGDIKLEGVKAVSAAGLTTYTGSKKNMILTGSDGTELDADVELNGTVMESGAANMTINVLWNTPFGVQIPIVCTFKGEKVAGIGAVDADNALAPVEYFNLQGIRVANPENGIFIRRQGTSVSKVAL